LLSGSGLDTEDASVVSGFADGVIVGSAIVKRLTDPDDALKAYLLSLRNASGEDSFDCDGICEAMTVTTTGRIEYIVPRHTGVNSRLFVVRRR